MKRKNEIKRNNCSNHTNRLYNYPTFRTGIHLLACCLLGMGVSSCSSDNEEVAPETAPAPQTLSLTVGDSKETGATVGAENMYSENPFIATIEDDGTIYAEHVGETTIHIGQEIINVTVEGSINLFKTPVIDWTATPSKVKQQHALGGWTTDIYYKDNGNNYYKGYLYKGCDTPVSYTFYLFSTSETLAQSTVYLRNSTETEVVLEHLSEHYSYVGYTGDAYLFANAYQLSDISVAIALTPDQYDRQDNLGIAGTTYHIITYVPFEYDDTEDETSANLKSVRENIQARHTKTKQTFCVQD